MDKNTFTGLFLILVIIVASTYFIKPSQQDIAREKHVQDSIALVKSGKAPAKVTEPAKAAPAIDTASLHGDFAGAVNVQDSVFSLENEHLKVNISNKGGRILSVQLKEYKTYNQKPLVLFEGDQNKFGLLLKGGRTPVSTNDLYFSPLPGTAANASSVTLRLTQSAGKYLEYTYTLQKDSFKVGLTMAATGMDELAGRTATLNWEADLKQKEKDLASEQRSSTAYYQMADNEVDRLNAAKTDVQTLQLGEKGITKWVSFKQHFFSNVLIPKDGFTKGTVSVTTPLQGDVVKSFAANLQLAFPAGATSVVPMEFYFGPNKFRILEKQGHDLERQIELGYWPLKYINRYVVLWVFNILDSFNWNYGLIILALTIILKLVLSPLTYKSYLSMAKMRVLKPEMDEIKAKVGEDNPTLLQQEYLKLYKKAGVNPLGGCIPMLLQLPIVMAFFFFFPNLFELRQESFLWMKDLSTYDAFVTFNFKIPFIGNHISLMCILMTISTLIYTYFNNQISGATGQMKYIGYISPIIFLGVLNSYPSGLNYYYFLANMLTFAQQFIIRQMVDDKKIHAQIQENKKKPQTGKKKSGFQQRMEDYMKEQQSKQQKTKKS